MHIYNTSDEGPHGKCREIGAVNCCRKDLEDAGI